MRFKEDGVLGWLGVDVEFFFYNRKKIREYYGTSS